MRIRTNTEKKNFAHCTDSDGFVKKYLGGEPVGLPCSRKARPEKALVGRAQ